MLEGDDRLELPGDVRLRGTELTDDVRQAAWPVNDAGAFVLERSGQTLDAITSALAGAYGLEERVVASDVASFVVRLNGLLLVNVRSARRARRWLSLAVRLLPLRLLPAPHARRTALGRARLRRLAAALAPRAVVLAVVAGAPPALVGLLPPASAAVAGCAVGLGLLLHEGGHVLALGRRPAALVLHGARVYVLHGTLQGARAALVPLAGPFVPGLLGLAAVAAATPVSEPTVALAGALLGSHVLGATVAGRDGRVACGL